MNGVTHYLSRIRTNIGDVLPGFAGDASVQLLKTLDRRRKGSIIGLAGTADIPGLGGRLNPILDTLSRHYLYADNISIDGEPAQPRSFSVDHPLLLTDAHGVRVSLVIRFIHGRTFLSR
jgi:hypothetical protein